MQSTTSVLGAMSVGFCTTANWCATDNPMKTETTVKITVQTVYNGTWFRVTIEKFVHEASVAAFDKFTELANEAVREYLKQKEAAPVEIEPSLLPESKSAISSQGHYLSSPPHKQSQKLQKSYSESESENEEFFDVENEDEETESVHETNRNTSKMPKNFSELAQTINREMEKLKQTVELTHTRLLGLEAAFINMQTTYTPVTSKSQSVRENLNQYNERLNAVTKLHRETEKEQQNLNKKLDQIDNKINSVIPAISWTKGITIAIFLFVWPFVAKTGWEWISKFSTKIWSTMKRS